MKLRMYAFIAYDTAVTHTDFREPGELRQLHFWLDHTDLHAWMEQLYHLNGGQKKRCLDANLALSSADLDCLEANIITGNLPKTKGLIRKRSDGWDDQHDLAFIERAREALADGHVVYYTTL